MRQMVFIGNLEPYLREIQGGRRKQYKRLLEQADRYRDMALPKVHPKESTTYMGIAIMNLALAYRVSGREVYLKDARRFMQAVLSYEKWGNAHLVNVDLSASWILFGLSLGYDWLKEELPFLEAEQIAQKLRKHAQIIYEYKKENRGKGWPTNFYQNHNWINMTGLATAGYALAGKYEEAALWIGEARENFARVFAYLADDGSNYEGVSYWRYGGMWLFVYAHLLKVQEGVDYFKTSGYLKNTFYYRLYQSNGDLSRQMNFGDCHDRHSGHAPCVYYKTAAEYRNGYAQGFGNLVLEEFLMEEARESKIKPGILPEAAFEFLWYDPTVEAKPLSELPAVRYFGDLGLLCIRESWERDSKVLTIKCGCPGGEKQWKTGWRLWREEGIDCLCLSHQHPDNLSYIFARGDGYLTCEDGYNRNIMPDSHNVILADGCYTDARDVNDVYMSSARLRLEKEGPQFDEELYGGRVTCMRQDGRIVLYRGETSGVYPAALKMKEVSRFLFTDGLDFWVFVDVCRSHRAHRYQLISNTDMEAQKREQGGFFYSMSQGNVHYQVFSDKTLQSRQYGQEIVSIMTTQEPDKVCRTNICTLALETAQPAEEQIFFECFTFEENGTQVEFDGSGLTVRQGDRLYRFSAEEKEENGLLPIKAEVFRNGVREREYRV